MPRRLLLIMALMLLSTCAIVRYDIFIHEETAPILNSFYWTADKIPLSELITGRDRPVIVPDFRSFQPGRSGKASLRIISTDKRSIIIEQITVLSDVTGESVVRTIEKATTPVERVTGVWVDIISVLNAGKSKSFVGAEVLNMSVAWREAGSKTTHITDFTLVKKAKTGIAWPT